MTRAVMGPLNILRTHAMSAVKNSGLRQRYIAEQLHLTEKHLSQMLLGRAPMSVEWADRILRICGKRLVISVEDDGRAVREQPNNQEAVLRVAAHLAAKDYPSRRWAGLSTQCQRGYLTEARDVLAVSREGDRTAP